MKTDTYFAPVVKEAPDELTLQISLINNNPVITGLLQSLSGILAIVNDKRQVIAFNDSFITMLGIADPSAVFGLRPGQILQCTAAEDQPGGCGTTKRCRTCGAAVAMVTSLAQNKPVERICNVSVQRDDSIVDISLNVKAHTIQINSRKFILLFIQDITRQQQQAALEHTFYHDISNLISMLLGASDLLLENHSQELAETVYNAAYRLNQEVRIQRYLRQTEHDSYKPMWHDTTTDTLYDEIEPYFRNHPVAQNKFLLIRGRENSTPIRTDVSLVLRILCNMLTNAFEATPNKGTVKLHTTATDQSVVFEVWNKGKIPDDIQERIFQRNFSTKQDSGRGIGTFSMKLFGEGVLGGKVAFTTSERDGTVFSLAIPQYRN